MDRKLHNLESTEVMVKSNRLATLVAKEVEYDDLMKKYDDLIRKYKINNKKLKQKRKLIRNMRRLLGKDKDGGVMMIQMMRIQMMTQLKQRKQNQRYHKIFHILVMEM